MNISAQRERRRHLKSLRSLTRGKSFESFLYEQLIGLFPERVKKKVRIFGYSGNPYIIDFVVDNRFLVEASSSFRVQQKLYSTMCKFFDLQQLHGTDKYRYIVVFQKLPRTVEGLNYPVYKQADAFQFKMYHPDNLDALKSHIDNSFTFKNIPVETPV